MTLQKGTATAVHSVLELVYGELLLFKRDVGADDQGALCVFMSSNKNPSIPVIEVMLPNGSTQYVRFSSRCIFRPNRC